MAHLSMGVLGSLQVSVDDTPVTTFESDKVRALLVYLAVEADRPHRRDSLAGLLWPECPEEVARHNLRQALSNLRRALGDHTATPPHLLISRESVRLNPDADLAVDLARFLQGTRTGDGGPLRAVRLEEAVRLYRGEFLQGFFLDDSEQFEQWALVQREGLHQRALDAYGWLAGYYEEHGDFAAARRHALRQLELEPWREEAYCQLMRALALDGQRAAALAQYEMCRRVLADELGVEPSAETRELAEQIRAGALMAKDHTLATRPAAPLLNLPASTTSFVGREQEMAELERLLADPQCRCISLVGPGGIGKTRLALQAAGQHRSAYAHGVAFVPLAPVDSDGAAVAAIAGAIHLSFYGPSDPKEQLLNTLRDRQMLLVLDNVEQLQAGAPPQADFVDLVLDILEHAPGVKLLVTSRQVLNLLGEWVVEVQGLACPETAEVTNPGAYAAVALFLQRTRRSSIGSASGEADLDAMAHICRLVEGTPLAIELAATWSRTLSPAEIAREIEGSLDFLSASSRDLPERHRSMRAVFDHSWQRLSGEEQQVLARLSVFRGGFSRQAAEQVAGASLPILSTLVDRSLVRRAAAGRYELHELLRQYSAGRLGTDPKARGAVQKAHCGYFLALAEEAAKGLVGRDQLEWLRRLEQDQGNLRGALGWALESDHAEPGAEECALRLSGALRRFWLMRGHFREGLTWLTKSLGLCPERHTAARAVALSAKGALLYALGDVGAARLPAEESVTICRDLGDKIGLSRALSVTGLWLAQQGELRLGRARLEEALAICRKAGDRWATAQALHSLGTFLAEHAGDPAGRAMLEESAAIFEELGAWSSLSGVLTALGAFDAGRGSYGPARAQLVRALAIAREIGHPLEVANALTYLGSLHRLLGEYVTSTSHLDEALQVYQAHGHSLWESEILCALAENALCQGDLTTARIRLQAADGLLSGSEDSRLRMLLRYCQGLLAHSDNDDLTAIRLLGEAATLAREGQYKAELARSLVALGRVRRALGQAEPASELTGEALEHYRALGDKLGIAEALEEMAAVSLEQGDANQAAALLSTAQALRERIGAPLPPVDRVAHDALVAAFRARLGEAAFVEACACAAARPFERVVDEVLGGAAGTSPR